MSGASEGTSGAAAAVGDGGGAAAATVAAAAAAAVAADFAATPVLESEGQQQQQDSGGTEPKLAPSAATGSAGTRVAKKTILRLSKEQYAILEGHFAENHTPPTAAKLVIAGEIGLDLERVTKWFVNRRSKMRNEEQRQREKRKAGDDGPGGQRSPKREKKGNEPGRGESSDMAMFDGPGGGATAGLAGESDDDDFGPGGGFGGGIAAAAAAMMNSDDEAEYDFWASWSGDHAEQLSVPLIQGDSEPEFFFREVWGRQSILKRRRPAGRDSKENEDLSAREVDDQELRIRALPVWKQIYLALRPLIRPMEERVSLVLQHFTFSRILSRRAALGFPPVFAVFSGPTVPNLQHVMEGESLTLGGRGPAGVETDVQPSEDAMDHIVMDAPGHKLSKVHARVVLDATSRGFWLESLSSGGVRVLRVLQPTSLTGAALAQEAGAGEGAADSSGKGGIGSQFRVEEAANLSKPGEKCALPNPAIIVFPGAVVCFQLFVVTERLRLPAPVSLLQQLQIQQGVPVDESTKPVEQPVVVAQTSAQSHAARVGPGYVEMLSNALLAYGNRATFRELASYTNARYPLLGQNSFWKRSLGTVLASDSRFEALPNPVPTRGRGKMWRLRNPDQAAIEQTEPIRSDLVDAAVVEWNTQAEKDMVSMRAAASAASGAGDGASGMMVVPPAPETVTPSPEPSSNLDAVMCAMMSMTGWSVVRDVADEVERRFPQWVATKTRNWRVSSVPGSLREGAETHWNRRAPSNNKNEYRLFRRSANTRKFGVTSRPVAGEASSHAFACGNAYDEATQSETDPEDFEPDPEDAQGTKVVEEEESHGGEQARVDGALDEPRDERSEPVSPSRDVIMIDESDGELD